MPTWSYGVVWAGRGLTDRPVPTPKREPGHQGRRTRGFPHSAAQQHVYGYAAPCIPQGQECCQTYLRQLSSQATFLSVVWHIKKP